MAAPARSTNTRGSGPCAEDDPYGLHSAGENYAASKIGAEYLIKHLSVDYGLPVTIIRIFSFYGPRGGGVTQRVDQVAQGLPVSVYPGVRNVHTPLYEDDYVEKTIGCARIARVGPKWSMSAARKAAPRRNIARSRAN